MQDPNFNKTYSDDWDDPLPEPARKPEASPSGAPPASGSTAQPAAPGAAPSPVGAQAPAQQATRAFGTLSERPPVAIPLSGEKEWNRFPGLMARSAVFRVGRADPEPTATGAEEPRPKYPQEELAAYGKSYEVKFEGPRLTMRDKRVWERVLQGAKACKFAGVEFALSASELSGSLGGCSSGPELSRVVTSLKRLCAARIRYRAGEATGGAFLVGSARLFSSGWRVSIDPDLVHLLTFDDQFAINSGRREKLKSDLAKWLHDFMSTHEKGYEEGFKLAELMALSGWRGDKGQFPSALDSALKNLVEECPEVVSGFEMRRKGRGSAEWRVKVNRGPETEKFRCPADEEAREQAKKAARAKKAGKRKGGVSL